MHKLKNIFLVLLIVVFAISSFLFIKELVENKKENEVFEDLQEIIEKPENSTNENDNTAVLKNEPSNMSSENTYNLENM